MEMPSPLVSVIVLAYGDEPLLARCVSSVLASTSGSDAALDLEVIVIDNGAARAVAGLSPHPRLRVVSMTQNTGFTGGCNAGAEEARGEHLVFLNSDALVEPRAVSALLAELGDPGVGLVCGSVRLLKEPELVNSCGNPVHLLGLVWAGGYREPAGAHAFARDITAVTGAFFAARRGTWHDLGGFDPLYFAYHEDAELSLRCWQRGLRVRYCADAVAFHDYDFSRNPRKNYLLERNRWLALLTVFPAAVLLVALPPLLAFETAVLVRATVQGWLADKLRGYVWLIRNASAIRARRGRVQQESSLSAREFAALLTARLEPTVLGPVPGLSIANSLLGAYWRLASRALPGGPRTPLSGR